MNENNNLSRVRNVIGNVVVRFCQARIGGEFYMSELTDAVRTEMQEYLAPDSPGRILRDLRAQGVVDYTLLSRRASLYQVNAVHAA